MYPYGHRIANITYVRHNANMKGPIYKDVCMILPVLAYSNSNYSLSIKFSSSYNPEVFS